MWRFRHIFMGCDDSSTRRSIACQSGSSGHRWRRFVQRNRALINIVDTKRTILSKIAALAVATDSHGALSIGDIAFIGFNSDGDDGFAIMATTAISVGEEIYFRDEEWGVTAFVGTGEGEFL